jgi:hypothetical protein
MYKIFLLTGAAMIVTATAASADPVPIVDYSFEARGHSDGDWRDGVPNWASTGNAGTQNPAAAMFAAVPDGNNLAFLGAGSFGPGASYEAAISQVLGTNVLAHTRYALSLDIGHRGDGYDLADFVVQLIAGGTVLASGSFANGDVAAGAFRTLDLTYDAIAGIAAPLEIRIAAFYDPAQGTTYRQIGVDNIRLDASPIASAVPEPAAWGMLIGGFGIAGGMMRRRPARIRLAPG